MKKVLAVCGLGQGTSLILKMNIEQVLNEQGVQAEVEHVDVSAASSMTADLIVTSRELAQNLQNQETRVVTVQNFFDVEEIRSALQEHL
ncbi:PTS system IIB component (L-Asc family) [Melghirimyces profundicolus]|uniref:PTS system IIB component (L-Asc family) n=1 Tax=Melghirimyces profundicolus TaxID=1242148 RepID=A0A2T6BQY2_9BACL|nr:PTS sugar transporter subunit IIB [Melghirimyces profundicolus]PTX58495.1 PTS system IIB component (L-Asc family) [Melghirimyces profundicolus]